jgi:hypothetical protein
VEDAGESARDLHLLNRERHEWIRFVNPVRSARRAGGLRRLSRPIVRSVQKGSMINSAQVYSTALYNNASVPFKDADVRGELHAARRSADHSDQSRADRRGDATKGVLPCSGPFPRFEIGQPGQHLSRLRARRRSEVRNSAIPNREDIPGQPDVFVSNRGYGTQASGRIQSCSGAQKVRLNDPVLSFLGTNDRQATTAERAARRVTSCTPTTAIRSTPVPYAAHGNRGLTASDDPTIPKQESGHPIRHEFTRKIPSSQCITCHVHNGNGFLNTYLGYMWWDEQTDGEHLYPEDAARPDARGVDRDRPLQSRAGGVARALGDPQVPRDVSELNPTLKKAQFSDYHGHGWMFQKVYKRDRKGNFLDADGKIDRVRRCRLVEEGGAPQGHPSREGDALRRLPLPQDVARHRQDLRRPPRGDRDRVQGLPRHGVAERDARHVGPGVSGARLSVARVTPFGVPQFITRGGNVIQRSMVEEGKQWTVPQLANLPNPRPCSRHTDSNRRADVGRSAVAAPRASGIAHHLLLMPHVVDDPTVSGVTWRRRSTPRNPTLHNEGDETQVYASYNRRSFALTASCSASDGTIQGHKIAPVRSSSAVTLSVQNGTRGWVANQVPTVSSGGLHRQRVQQRTCRTRSARPRRSSAPIVTCRVTATTTRGWPRSLMQGDESSQLHGPLHLRRAVAVAASRRWR